MPFKSDKQRRYLWSQKPEVARQIAYKQDGGGVYDFHDDAAQWWNQRMAGVPQHRGYVDDPDDITETYTTNPDDPHGGRNLNPNIPIPAGYTDMATYYTPGMRQLGAGADQRMKMQQNNQALAQKAAGMNFQFNTGGAVPAMGSPKKVTQKDRYGNQVSVEYESEVKPLDVTKLMEKSFDAQVPEIPQVPYMQVGGDVSFGGGDHPGQPMGSDTVPAWLTPGEFVVNKEAMDDPDNAAMVKAINDQGRMIQHMNKGGDAMDFAGPESLSDEEIAARMAAMRQSNPATPPPMAMPVPGPWTGRPEGYTDLLHDREGYRDDIYLDSLGKPTVGYGHLLPDEYLDRVGESPWDRAQHNEWFEEDSARGVEDAIKNVGRERWSELSQPQKAALASMAFQLGGEGQSKFKNMLDAVKRGDNEAVRREAEDSKWFEQTPTRVRDLQAAFMYDGGPVYAYRGYDVAEQDAMDIEDPMADMSGDWVPPVYEADAISPMEQAILDQEAMPSEDTGEAPDDMGSLWSDIADWALDGSIADEANAASNAKIAENNAAAAAETLAEMEAAVAAGEPVNEHSFAMAQKAAEHTAKKADDALFDLDGADDLVEANVKGNPDDDRVILEELATSPEYENEDDPSKPSEKGQQSPDEVAAAGEEAVAADPSIADKAQGFFKDAFSDLFDGKELARMAIMYAGSRALGYSHGGSLNWAAKQYVTRLDAKHDQRANFIKTNAKNYTPASLDAYKKSGNLADLVPVGGTQERTGEYKTFYGNGKQVKAEKVKVGDQVMWIDSQGRRVDGTKYNDNPANVRGTKEWRTRINDYRSVTADQLKSMRSQFDMIRDGENVSYKTDINPHTSAGKIAEWASDNNVAPEDLAGLVESAYHDALNDRRQDGAKARDLVPYLNQLVIRNAVGQPDAFLAKGYDGDGPKQYVSGEKLASLNNSVSTMMRSRGMQGDTKDLANQFYDAAIRDWNALDTEVQQQWIRKATNEESGFYKFAEAQATKYMGG